MRSYATPDNQDNGRKLFALEATDLKPLKPFASSGFMGISHHLSSAQRHSPRTDKIRE